MENKTAKKKLNIVDVVILLLLALCLVGVGLRFAVVLMTPDDTHPEIECKEYIISYITRDHRYSVADYLEEGTELRFYDTNDPFGITVGTPDTPNAEKWYYNDKGEYVMVLNNAEDDFVARCDIRGDIKVKGKYIPIDDSETDEEMFVIEESEWANIVINKPFILRSDKLIITVYVTAITPVE